MNIALQIMIYGMTGIFAAILIIMAVTYILKKSDRQKSNQVNPVQQTNHKSLK